MHATDFQITLKHDGGCWWDFPWHWEVTHPKFGTIIISGIANTRWGAIYAARKEWRAYIRRQEHNRPAERIPLY